MIFINRVDADLMVLKDMDTREGQLKQQVEDYISTQCKGSHLT